MSDRDVRKLAKIVADHSRQIKGLSGGPQAAYSSIEGGSMDAYDNDGKMRLRIGAQDDGTHAVKYVQGPPPPRPTAPVVSVDGPVVRVRWDGMLLGGHIPEDFSRIDVHFALASDDLEADEAVRGNLATSAGNETVLAATSTGTYRVGLVAMSQSRARSEMSEVVDVDVTLVDIEGALDAVVENARGGSNYYSPEPPSGTDHDPDRDLWFDTSVDAEGLVSYSPHRWDADLLEWVSVADQRTAALQDALGDFEGTVEQRFTDAGTAIDGLRDSLTNLDETTLPALRQDLDAAEGRLGEAEGQITDAFGQIEAVPGQIATARQEAIDAAQQELNAVEGTLQSAIDAKRDITWSTSSPPAVYDGPVGSTWFKMSGNGSGAQVESQWRWQGDVWVSTILSAAVLAQIDIGTGTFGEMDGIRLKAGSIYADRIVSGLSQNMVPDPGFVNDEITGYRLSVANSYQMAVGIDDGVLWFDAPQDATLNANISLASTGDLWAWAAYPGMRVVARISARTAESAQFRLTIRYSLRGGGSRHATMSPLQHTAGAEWAEYSSAFVLPPDAVGYSIVVQVQATSRGLVEFRAPFAAATVGTTVIEDGAVTTGKLRADVLEVGNLKAGTGEIAELVSRKIAAATGQFLELDVGQLTVTEQTRLADVVAEQIAADTAQFMELEVGKLVASEGILDEAVIKQLFAEVVVSQMSFADSFIGGNAILEGSITAESGIIGSLDLGVAIVGKLHGQYVEAGSIDTEQLAFGAATGDILSVDALNFKTAVGLDIRGSSFRAGDAVEITEDFGIRQFGPDGALNVSLPSDGSPAEFRGDLSARTLTATGRMSIQGPGAVASGGVLELESGVVPPVVPPSVSNSLQTTKFPPVADDESVWGLAWAGGSWWRGINKRAVVVGDRIERISPTGELESSFPTDVNPQGLTSIGDELFLLGTLHANSQGVDQVLVYSLTGTLKRRWEYSFYGTGAYQPGIGTDGTNILIAQPWQDGRLTWRRFNKTTGALLAQVDSTHQLSADVVNILITQADYGTQRVIVTTGSETGPVEVYTPTGTHIDYGGWFANHRQRVRGTVFKDGYFYHITAGGDLVKMSDTRFPNGEPGADTDDWWAAITWADGTHETTLGPARQFLNRRRHDARVSFGSPPEGATRARVYFARGVTEPSRTSFHRVGEVSATAEQSIIVQPTGWESLANPPASNTFPQSTPGLIRSGFGNYWVDGTGAGQWGPLTFHADGSMTSAAVPTWTPITSFSAGFTAATWTDVPAYRVWPDGKVEWRGTITGTFNGTVFPFVVPPAARAGRTLNFSVACGGTAAGTSATTRLEFSPANDPGGIRVFRGDSDKTWVDLGSIYYYLT